MDSEGKKGCFSPRYTNASECSVSRTTLAPRWHLQSVSATASCGRVTLRMHDFALSLCDPRAAFRYNFGYGIA
jgi:hypothetical protein